MVEDRAVEIVRPVTGAGVAKPGNSANAPIDCKVAEPTMTDDEQRSTNDLGNDEDKKKQCEEDHMKFSYTPYWRAIKR